MKKYVIRKISRKDNKKGYWTESIQYKGGFHYLLI